MTIYRWQQSDISGLTISHAQKHPFAWIEASASATASFYQSLPDALRKAGYQVFADVHEGKPALRVRGFAKDEDLIGLLTKSGAIHGAPIATITEADTKKHGMEGAKQWLADHSMVASGVAYLVADSFAFMSGYVRKDYNGMQQGAIWAAASAMLVLFGTRDPKHQMENLYNHMQEHLRQNGVKLSPQEEYALQQMRGHPEDFYNRLVNFIYEHPVEINNTLQGYGGLQLMLAGLNQKQVNVENILSAKGSPNFYKMLAGFCVASGFWTSMFLHEDPETGLTEAQKNKRFMDQLEGKEPEKLKDISLFEDPAGWLRQKPLRLAGYGAIINNAAVALGAIFYERPNLKAYGEQAPALRAKYAAGNEIGQSPAFFEEQKAFQKIDIEQSRRASAIKYDLMTPIPNIIANYLYAMSPKDRRGSLKEEGYLDEMYTLAANLFHAMPPEDAKSRIEAFAGHMANRPEMKSSAREIALHVQEKLQQLADNPWLQQAPAPEPKITMNAVPNTLATQVAHLQKGVLPEALAAQHSPS